MEGLKKYIFIKLLTSAVGWGFMYSRLYSSSIISCFMHNLFERHPSHLIKKKIQLHKTSKQPAFVCWEAKPVFLYIIKDLQSMKCVKRMNTREHRLEARQKKG